MQAFLLERESTPFEAFNARAYTFVRRLALVDDTLLLVGIGRNDSRQGELFMGRLDPTKGEPIVWKRHL